MEEFADRVDRVAAEAREREEIIAAGWARAAAQQAKQEAERSEANARVSAAAEALVPLLAGRPGIRRRRLIEEVFEPRWWDSHRQKRRRVAVGWQVGRVQRWSSTTEENTYLGIFLTEDGRVLLYTPWNGSDGRSRVWSTERVVELGASKGSVYASLGTDREPLAEIVANMLAEFALACGIDGAAFRRVRPDPA